MRSQRLIAVSLYTGVGGLDFGFEAAGYSTKVAVEMDAAACRTIRLNRPEWNVIEGDIHDVSSERILEKACVEAGELDILIGGPPCQPFSKSSYWVSGDTLRLDDPRANTLIAYLRVLRDTRPKAFLMENVQGLTYKGKDEGLKLILQGIEQINAELGTAYTVTWKTLNAAHYGVPQNRERVFLIGSRDGKAFEFPAYTHALPEEADLSKSYEPFRTTWDAIGDLPVEPDEPSLSVGGKWGDLLPTIPEGQNYLWHTDRGGGAPLFGWRTRYWSFLLKLSKSKPSWTIQAQPGSAIGPFHWANRKLSSLEMSRLQTFPDGIRFECSRTDIQKMIGNAVPSLLSEILGREIRKQFLDCPEGLGELLLVPPKRPLMLLPSKVSKLPAKYRSLIGEHSDHPGTKKKRAKQSKAKAQNEQQLLINLK